MFSISDNNFFKIFNKNIYLISHNNDDKIQNFKLQKNNINKNF